ncbi:OmpH family outer membrane protein [Magnetofaba australis]|uniref:Putative outer membrane chaperone Skp n=1 Tax=Magnetofaba australis IT-1 TaxID=1434232 RepID=A0A1Y2K8P7_9PROT|nr:OmpH family outer membrane protein [Magnetofaba australis]OSM05165.1 putative outer membrane chaperone Skp [Magnetofaba australis IT-1]
MSLRLICAAVALVSLLWVESADAADKFAFVDVQRAISSSDAAKQARNLLMSAKGKTQAKVDAKKSQIETMQADLKKRGALMTPEAKAEFNAKLQREMRDFRRMVEDLQLRLDRENARWTKRITGALREVIEEMGREKGYTAVFGKGQVLYATDTIDITDQVLKRLNERTASLFK